MKVKPKSHVSPKGAATGKKLSAKTTKTATEPKASKYFQSPVKKEEEEEYDSEDDFDIVTPAAPALAAKMEKDGGEEEDSEEDEGDWEEVEGLSTSVGFVREKVSCVSIIFTLVACEKGRVKIMCFPVDQSWRNHWVQLSPQNLPCHPNQWK